MNRRKKQSNADALAVVLLCAAWLQISYIFLFNEVKYE